MAEEAPDDPGETERPPMTPEEIDHTHLPDQTAYKVDIDAADSFSFEHVTTYPVVITNEIKLLYFEMTPPGGIDWHTHSPQLDQINMCLEGKGRIVLEQEDGSEQTLVYEPMELVYLPAGARHKLEAAGDETFKGLSIYQFESLARLEMLEGFGAYHFDDWPVALWIDRKRDEVVKIDDDAVTK